MPRSAARLGIVGFDSLPVHSGNSVKDSTREPRVMHLTWGFSYGDWLRDRVRVLSRFMAKPRCFFASQLVTSFQGCGG